MDKKWKSLLTASLLAILAGCGNTGNAATESSTTAGSATEANVITIGSQASDAQIWEYIANSEAAKEEGLTIEVKEIDGGPQLNTATAEKEVDVNAFQSWAYLQSFNEQTDAELTAFATIYLEPMGIYSDKHAAIEEIPEGATVAIADNPSNASRGLLLLQAAGLITLKEGFDALGTTSDIVDNPKNLQFVEIDDTTGPRVLSDVDVALISNTVAIEGGLNVLEDSLYHEEVSEDTKNNINILVTQKENAEDPEFLKLAELYHSEEVQDYITQEFDGTKVQVQKEISYLEE